MVLVYDMGLLAVEKRKNNYKWKHKYTKKACRPEYIAAGSKEKVNRTTFNEAMSLTIIIGQVFGLNPVLGFREKNISKLRFSKYSWRCIYSYLSIVGQGALVFGCSVKLLTDNDATIASSSSLVFYGTNFITTILFLRIATKWPKLCQYISKVEAADPNVDTSILKKCNISCILILSLATLEHVLSDISGFAAAMACQPKTELYKAYMLQGYDWLWTFVDYHLVITIFVQFLNIQCTFNWNFANVFVICVSWYLESRIKQINNRLNLVRGKHASAVFWRTMREDYSKATNLVRKVDDVISGVIFISFANNLFYICWQLLHVLQEGFHVQALCAKSPEERPIMHGFEQVVYFAYSFFFLMARSLALSLIAAKVHSASQDSAKALYEVPSSAYCVEVQRFIDQVHGETVALTGLQFFNVTRGLVLAISGTVVTYELVLMQFSGVSPTSAPPPAQITMAFPIFLNNLTTTAP